MKQYTVSNSVWTTPLKYVAFALIVHFFINWFGNWSSDKNTAVQKIKVPEVTGRFENTKPEALPLVIRDTLRLKGKTVYTESPVSIQLLAENKALKKAYSKMNDSLKGVAYSKAIELSSFTSKFEDQNLKLTMRGKVRGEVQEISPEYTIKAKTVDVKYRERVFSLLAGAEIGSSISEPKIYFKGNLMFQNRKGDIISASFDTDHKVWIGYNKRIFSVKR